MIELSEGETALPEAAPVPNGERPREYVADIAFDAMGLSPELRRAVAERGYTHPTPVQAKAYDPVVAGRDLIVRSKTGTGKTAAFGMPLIDRIPLGTREVRALILCPTRELALQVAQELADLAKYRDIQVTAIYGGASLKQQEDALRAGSAIVVGTPGRVYDHIRRGNLKLGTAAHAVLDEADEMLNQGFYEEVTRILDCLPQGRQVLLFSATVPEDIQRLIAKYTENAETLLLSGDVFTVEHIHHVRYDVSEAYPKPRNLLYLLEMEEPENAIIFCNTRDDTELVTAVLNRNGLDAELLNGDLPQKERERVMAKVKRGEVAYMVATDIAARGIDISDLSHVINYSLPEDPAVYLHRVGRTGRIGRKGTALNLVTGRELMTLTALEKKYGVKFEERTMPTAEQATTLWTERHVREVKRAAQDSIYEGYLTLAEQIKVRPDADELIAFLLRSFFSHLRMDRARAANEQGETAPTASARAASTERREHDRDRDRSGRRGRERGPRGGRGERGERSERSSGDGPREGSSRRAERGGHHERSHLSPAGEEGAPAATGPARCDEGRAPGAVTATAAAPAPAPVESVTRWAEPEAEHSEARPPATAATSEDRVPSVSQAAAAASPVEHGAPPPARPGRPARKLTDRELFAQLERSQGPGTTPMAVPAPAAAPVGRSASGTARLNDREIFEAMQAGRPVPAPVTDERSHPAEPTPTRGASADDAPSEGSSPEGVRDEVRATRLRGGGEAHRGRRRGRDGEPGERASHGRSDRRAGRPSRPSHSVRGTADEVANTGRDKAPAPPPPGSTEAKPVLRNDALIAALERGAPIPPIDDPTVEGAASDAGKDGTRRRRGRGRREERRALEPGEARLWLNVGRSDGYESDALGTALGGLGARRELIHALEVLDTFSYVTVAEVDAPAFQALSGTTLGEKTVKIEPARK